MAHVKGMSCDHDVLCNTIRNPKARFFPSPSFCRRAALAYVLLDTGSLSWDFRRLPSRMSCWTSVARGLAVYFPLVFIPQEDRARVRSQPPALPHSHCGLLPSNVQHRVLELSPAMSCDLGLSSYGPASPSLCVQCQFIHDHQNSPGDTMAVHILGLSLCNQ